MPTRRGERDADHGLSPLDWRKERSEPGARPDQQLTASSPSAASRADHDFTRPDAATAPAKESRMAEKKGKSGAPPPDERAADFAGELRS